MQSDTNRIPFGVPSLDEKIGGMRRGSITLLYSHKNEGKTDTALRIAHRATCAGYNVLFRGSVEWWDKSKYHFTFISLPMRPSDLLHQLKEYKESNGASGDLVVIDDVYLMGCDDVYSSPSEKCGNIFKGLHEIAKEQNISLLVCMQIPKQPLSKFITMHCEYILELMKVLEVTVQKNRAGDCFFQFLLDS